MSATNTYEDLEFGIIGDFLSNNVNLDDLRRSIRSYGLTPAHFSNSMLRDAFVFVNDSKSTDSLTLAVDLSKKIGNEMVEKLISCSCQSMVEIHDRLNRLIHAGNLRILTETFNSVITKWKDKASVPFMADELAREIKKVCSDVGVNDDTAGCSLADFADIIPEEQNPNALFKGGWLRKGMVLVLAASTGIGKSVITIQLSYAWALGREIFGLRPARPIRIGIFQTEDDDEEIAWFRDSMRKGFAMFNGWTAEDIAAAEKNIHFHSTKFKVGTEFVSLMASVQRERKYDIIIINPLQGVCGCSLTDNDKLRPFLTEHIDPVIKSPDAPCGLMIVHHTNKPTIHNGQQGFGGDQYAEYLGAGAASMSNWMRAMLVIMKTDKADVFKLIAAKRGKRLEWPKLIGMKHTKPTRIICHAPEDMKIAFWREDSSIQPAETTHAEPGPRDDAEYLAKEFRKEPRSLTEAREYATAELGKSKNRSKKAYDMLTCKPEDFGLVIEKCRFNRQSFIGTAEGVKKAIFSLREKTAKNLLENTP